MTEPASDEPQGTFKQFVGCLALFIVVPALIGGIIFLVMRLTGGGEVLARMPLSPSPSEMTLQLKAETPIQVWTYVDMRHPGISAMSATEDLPHVIDYVIEVRPAGSAGSPQASLRCNPFDSHIAKTSGTYNSIGEPSGRYYDGLVGACALRLPAGTYTVRAHRQAVSADARFTFSKTELILRPQ